MHFDIVHAANPRYPGGTSAALRAELKAGRRFGQAAAILPVIGRSGGLVGRFERRLAALIDELDIPWLAGDQPVTCDILFAHHPQVFEHMPLAPLQVRPRQVVCVMHHPPFDGAWQPQYDLMKVARNLERSFGAPVSFAPVGPKVRAQLTALSNLNVRLLDEDLHNLIDLAEWPFRPSPPAAGKAVLGRHSRPSPLKWPDTAADLLAAYPDRRNLTIRVVGGLPDEIGGWIGSNWQVMPFADGGTEAFLDGLDFFVYFHSRRWVEAFGIGIAEALASGTVAILDPSFEGLFGTGAMYTEPAGVAEIVERFLSSPEAYERQALAGRNLVEAKFSLDTFPARMRRVYLGLGLPAPAQIGDADQPSAQIWNGGTASQATSPRLRAATPRRVLCVATNGIGLGHITRLMAIAERMSEDLVPIFFTRSGASTVIRERGHAVDYIPSPQKFGVTDASWNNAYAQELLAALETLDIAAVLFDGPQPFPGLFRVASARPDLAWIWVRRALWRAHHRLDAGLQACFDMIIEPGEIAADEDHGPTVLMPGPITAVGPVLLNAPDHVVPRDEAARMLGSDPGRFTAAIQLGSQRNFDYDNMPAAIATALQARKVQLVVIENPLAPPSGIGEPDAIRTKAYPLSVCFPAIDLMITNAGYNAFHECVLAGMPTIFVPNEAPEMDDQLLRATYAHSAQLALRLRRGELSRLEATIDLAMSAGFRAEVRRRSSLLSYADGGAEAARAVEELVFSVRAGVPLHAALPRV